MTRAIIYARFSPRVDAADCESIEKQVAICRQWCDEHQYDVAGVFEDPDISGAEKDRPKLWEAIAALKKGDVLVVRWFSRLARDVFLSIYIEQEVLRVGATIESASGEGSITDAMTAEQRLMVNVLRSFDAYQREIIGIRTSLGMRRNQRNGQRQGHEGKVPYGYRLDPADNTRMLPASDERRAMKWAALLKQSGLGVTAIADRLNDAGITRRGKGWTRQSAFTLLRRAERDLAHFEAEQGPIELAATPLHAL